jgi:hypothetical protein
LITHQLRLLFECLVNNGVMFCHVSSHYFIRTLLEHVNRKSAPFGYSVHYRYWKLECQRVAKLPQGVAWRIERSSDIESQSISAFSYNKTVGKVKVAKWLVRSS